MACLQSFPLCNPAAVADYQKRLKTNTDNFQKYHHSLYLGGNGLKPFADHRLVNYW